MDKIKYFEDRVHCFRDSEEIVDFLDMLHQRDEIAWHNELSQHIDGMWVLVNELLDYVKADENG
jgi:hypothetical protein